VHAFWVKLGANDLNCVDVSLNPTYSLTDTEHKLDTALSFNRLVYV